MCGITEVFIFFEVVGGSWRNAVQQKCALLFVAGVCVSSPGLGGSAALLFLLW